MALTEETVVDKIEILENGVIQVRLANRVIKDGAVIASASHRYCVVPGDSAPDGADQKVLDAIATFHTAQVIADYQASLPAVEEPIE